MKKIVLCMIISTFLVAGYATLPFGKEKEPTIKLKESEYNKLLNEKAALEEILKSSEEQIELLKKEKAGEKIILLFDGKIKYSVEATAAMDYEELLVLSMLDDPKFKEAMDMGGKEADIALIGLLKKITPDDRRITREEVKTYLKSKKNKNITIPTIQPA
ncbi:MAG: hypothetical protein DRH11_16840 [Deltaproteobacteria bacterium]|nr:MAG: hypothetical protein DRH11_16840 [Deltaproteobacteria bacterium]